VQLYHEPADASWILTAAVVVGLIVKATASMFVGVVALSVYVTAVAVYPLMAPEPEPACERGRCSRP
jgi:hypothetical protein